jgi:RNA polymerase sigma-70 factor (ECF subfamily)
VVDGRRPNESNETVDRLAALYETGLPTVFGFCRTRLPVHDAEDVTAEVFCAAAEQLRSRPDAELTTAWLVTAARNRITDRWRHKARWTDRLAFIAASQPTTAPETNPPGGDVIDALDRLPTAQRAALVLHHVDGRRVAEIAGLLNRSDRAVESLLARARRKLLAELGGSEAELDLTRSAETGATS